MNITHLRIQRYLLEYRRNYLSNLFIDVFFFQPAPPPQQSYIPAVLPSAPAPYQPPSYASVTTPIAAQQPTEKYGNDTKQTSTRIDLSQYERQQAELEEREKRLAERERAITNSAISGSESKND